MYPIHELLVLIRESPKATEGWPKLLDFCRNHCPDPVWDQFTGVQPAADVETAVHWLKAQLTRSPLQPPRGIYLGLDTLNQDRDPAQNLEIAISTAADPESLSQGWAFERESNWYGTTHLIKSLVSVEHLYEKSKGWDFADFADYVLFLGYSGLVLAEAFDHAAPPNPFIAIWGFHDGDLFCLCRRTRSGFERIVT